LNALSSLWHPTQILADLLTLYEHAHLFVTDPATAETSLKSPDTVRRIPQLRSLNVAYVGDSANVLHDMLVTYPRLGHKLRIASPPKAAYQCPPQVWARVRELGCDQQIFWGGDPREAVQGADVVVTDTW
jgi:ornithine carbamoyltransferase